MSLSVVERLSIWGLLNFTEIYQILHYSYNYVVKTLHEKALAIVEVVIGVIFGIYAIDGLNMDEGAIVIIIASIISAIFTYALGEIIQLLEDIKNK